MPADAAEHIRRWEVEELEAIASAKHRELEAVAARIGRTYETVRWKFYEMRRARAARAATGAFLPDDGLPFRVLIARLWRTVS